MATIAAGGVAAAAALGVAAFGVAHRDPDTEGRAPELADGRPYAEVTLVIVPDGARGVVDTTITPG